MAAQLAAGATVLARFRVRFLRAILRQDAGWHDTHQPQELATQMGEAGLDLKNANAAVMKDMIANWLVEIHVYKK